MREWTVKWNEKMNVSCEITTNEKRVRKTGLLEHFLDLRDDLGLPAAGNRELLATGPALDLGRGAAEDDLARIALRARNLQEPGFRGGENVLFLHEFTPIRIF